MFWIISRSLLSPHFGLSITLVEVFSWPRQSIKLCSRTFVASAHLCSFCLLIVTTGEWFASHGIASILLFSKSSSNGWLRYLHPCPMEMVCDVTDWCSEVFLHVAQCFCHQLLLFSLFDLLYVCCSVRQRCLSFSEHWCWTSYLQCLCNGSDRFPLFYKLQNSLLFTQRQLFHLHVFLSFLTQMQFSQAKPKAKSKSRHSERFIV